VCDNDARILTDPTAAFFDDLRHRGYEPLLARKHGSVRVEVTKGRTTERWLVDFDDGEITVSKRNRRADTTVRAERRYFDRIVSGETNAMAALLRGLVSVEGNLNVLALFQRLIR
jgi:putative sterol carrier protein